MEVVERRLRIELQSYPGRGNNTSIIQTQGVTLGALLGRIPFRTARRSKPAGFDAIARAPRGARCALVAAGHNTAPFLAGFPRRAPFRCAPIQAARRRDLAGLGGVAETPKLPRDTGARALPAGALGAPKACVAGCSLTTDQAAGATGDAAGAPARSIAVLVDAAARCALTAAAVGAALLLRAFRSAPAGVFGADRSAIRLARGCAAREVHDQQDKEGAGRSTHVLARP